MVAYRVIGNDLAVTLSAEGGQLQLNAFEPVMAAVIPVIGYDKSTELAAEALKSGEGILELIREKHILTDAQIDEILNPAALTGQGR